MAFRSTNIGGNDYLHYYFSNARISIQDFSNSKRVLLAKQKRVFDTYKTRDAMRGSKDMTQAQSMLNSIMSPNGVLGEQLQTELSTIFNGQVAPSSASSSGFGNFSFFDIGQMRNNKAELAQMADSLAENVGTFVAEAQKCLDSVIKVLTQYSDTIVTSALAAVATEQAGMSAQELCQKYLGSGAKSKVISTDDANLSAALQGVARLRAQIESLRNIQGLNIGKLSYSSSDNRSRRSVGSQEELISVLVGKIGGNLTDVGGIVEEMATKMAVDAANAKMANLWNKKIPKAEMSQVIRGKNISVDKKIVNNFTNVTENTSPLARTYNKGNVRVMVNEGKVSLDFSMAVSRSKAKNLKSRSTVRLQEGTSLDTVLAHLMNIDGNVTKRYVYHIAASNDFTGKINKSGKAAQSGRLVSAWRDLVDYAGIAYFLNAINGGKYAANNNLLLIVNRQVMSISDVYSKAILNPQGIKIEGGKQRNKFTALNTWVGNAPSAPGGQVRSNRVQKDLVSAFNATKTTIKLDLSALGYNIPEL